MDGKHFPIVVTVFDSYDKFLHKVKNENDKQNIEVEFKAFINEIKKTSSRGAKKNRIGVIVDDIEKAFASLENNLKSDDCHIMDYISDKDNGDEEGEGEGEEGGEDKDKKEGKSDQEAHTEVDGEGEATAESGGEKKEEKK